MKCPYGVYCLASLLRTHSNRVKQELMLVPSLGTIWELSLYSELTSDFCLLYCYLRLNPNRVL